MDENVRGRVELFLHDTVFDGRDDGGIAALSLFRVAWRTAWEQRCGRVIDGGGSAMLSCAFTSQLHPRGGRWSLEVWARCSHTMEFPKLPTNTRQETDLRDGHFDRRFAVLVVFLYIHNVFTARLSVVSEKAQPPPQTPAHTFSSCVVVPGLP